MSIIFQSQKFKASTLETITNVLLNEQNFKIITDNSEGLKQIELRNDDGNEIIEDNEKLSQYESQIFDEVIESGIPEQLIQLANLLKLQSKSENSDKSSIKASLATTDNSKVLNIVMSFNDDKIQSLDVSVDEKQWNISVNQEDENLVKYCKFLKDKLSATPKVSQFLDLNQLLKVAKLDVPIMETPIKDMINSYIEYGENLERGYVRSQKHIEDFDDEVLSRYDNGKVSNYISKLLKIKSDVGILKPYVLNNQDYNFVSNSSYETGYKYEAKDSYFNPPYLWSHETIKRKLITLGEDFINQLQQKQNNKINQLRKVFKVCDNDFSTKRNLLLILYLLTILINNTSHSIESRSLENFSTGDPPDIYGYQFSKKGFASERVFCIEIDYVVKLEHEKYSKYYHDIFIQLDNISKTKLFSSIAYQINDFDRILKGYENLSTEEFCKQVYQQTVKSFQDEPEKLEIILADFYKLTQEAIFKSNTNILTTAQTTFIESKLQENKNNLEIKIHLTGSFPEPITGIFIASNQINTDTELNFFTTEDSLRSINQEDITTYQNQLFKEVFSETIEANKVLFLANCLKMTFKDSKNNQYSGILATNDKGHQIKYKLTPIQQNKYNLELESPQFNWKHDYQISLNNPNHVNFLHRLDSDLVEFILSLTDEETVLKKAITLTPHPEAENYNSGYLTTPNGNNRINYQIQVNSENNQNQFELSANKKTWTYQLDTSNLANRTFLQHVNPSLAVALEIQEALRVLANDDKIQAVLIRRQKNNDNNAISVYSKEETTTELTVLIPSSSTDSSLQSVLSASQEIRIEKTYISDSLRYKLSFSNDDADAKAITITQIIDSTGKIQVQTTQKHPVKVFSDTGIITHHSNRVSSETIEVEYNDYLEDATFTYHTGGQLIISNLIEGMKVEHYAKPPIQNIVNGVVESFIILKPEDKIVFLNREQNKLEQFLNNLLSVSNFQSNQDLSLQEEASINPELKLTLFRGKYGGIKNGQVIILFMISHAHGYFSEGLAPVMFNNKWGYVNTQGEMFIACQFESAGDFSEGLAPVMLNNKWGYVNTQGIIVIPCQFEDVKEFSEELAPVRLNDKWGYVNTQGEIFISCKFEDAETFSEGLAAVQGGYSQRDVYNWDKWGYINKKGKVVISFEFIIASHFSNGVAYVRQYIDYARGGLIDKRGEWIAGFHFDNFSEFYGFKEGLALVAREGKYETKYGFISARGKLIIPCEFDSANEISEGFASVKKDGKWGFIDKVGRVLKEPQFDGVGDFSEGLAPVKKDGKWGYIDRKGYEVIWYQFDDNGYFSEGLAKVHKNGKWGYIDKTGKLVIPYQFDEAYGFQEGLAKVIVNEQEYLIDKSQTIWVSESDYDKITIQMP